MQPSLIKFKEITSARALGEL